MGYQICEILDTYYWNSGGMYIFHDFIKSCEAFKNRNDSKIVSSLIKSGMSFFKPFELWLQLWLNNLKIFLGLNSSFGKFLSNVPLESFETCHNEQELEQVLSKDFKKVKNIQLDEDGESVEVTLQKDIDNRINPYNNLGIGTMILRYKTDRSGNSVWPEALVFQKLAKMKHFWHF